MNFVIVGIVKDSAKTLLKDVTRIIQCLEEAKSIKWFIVESNSKDNTVEILDQLASMVPNFSYKCLDHSSRANNCRTIALAEARNMYLSEIRINPSFFEADYVVVMDFNGLNNQINKASFQSCFEYNFWDVCTANQNGPYYDIWALRHKLWSPNDCWDSHKFFRQYMKSPEKALFTSVHSRMITIPTSSDWIEVDSAFGGLAIYKKATFMVGEYHGTDQFGQPVCEHVPFHKYLTENKYRIFINPRFINTNRTDHSKQFSRTYRIYRKLLYPKKFFKKI